jgi:hypothetical protein
VTESPRTVLSSAAMLSPEANPAAFPSSLISNTALSPTASVFSLAPGWVYPSMFTGSNTTGSPVFGEMV